jgi:hypothetical protein
LDHRALGLGEYAHHLKHRLAGRRRGVETLLVQEQVNAERVQLAEEADQSCRLRPRRSTDQAMTTSNWRLVASRHIASNAGRLSRPLAPLMP